MVGVYGNRILEPVEPGDEVSGCCWSMECVV